MTTTPEAAAAEPAAAAPEPQAAPETVAETTEVDAPAEPEAAVENGAVEPAKDTPKKRGRKRKVSVTEDKTPGSEDAPASVDGAVDAAADPTAAAVEKSPKEKKPATKKAKAPPKPKAAAASPATPAKRKIGRPRKTAVKEESESEDETESELRQRVDALPEDVKAKFGWIVWAKMVGFPYWPALITDPRLIQSKYHASALKEIETKYFVCFYQSNDFSPVLFKNIEAWDDSKHSYRTGHPTKDAKAPKRRSQLMTAIELADKDAPLAIEDRMDGLMKAVPEEPESSPEEVEEKPPAPKKKMGRPPGSKNKPKTASGAAASATEAASPAPAKGKRGRKKSTEEPEEDKVATPETPDDEDTVPPLTKDEIKAKVASRKSPSKKKAAASAEDKSAAAAAKKATKASGGTKGESATTAAKAGGAGELDSKRKKEIELVVPRKSVKSADIREATEEAARKKPGPREKPKDKGDYKVGNLTQFAGKMNRLYANESSKNNDELIVLLTQLFEEKMVYRSDAERSGVAAVIAVLRKSQNPTVAQTASAVRKHLMHVLNNDVIEEPTPALKKHKADGADAGEPKASKKQKTSPVADAAGDAPSSTPVPAELVDTKSEANGSSEVQEETVTEAPQAEAKPEAGVTEAMPIEENKPSPTQEPEQKLAPTEVTTEETTKQEPTSTPAPASPIKSDDPVLVPTSPKPDPSGDKHRMVCIDMLKKSLAPIGERSEEIAREIEAHVFERFSESNEEYRSCARSITFGLKKHAHVRERLKHGDLHALELAYTPDEILKPT